MTAVVRSAAVDDIDGELDTDPVFGPPEQLGESADLMVRRRPQPTRHAGRDRRAAAPSSATMPEPVIGILGNHDDESDAADDVRGIIEASGATVLDRVSARSRWVTSESASPARPASAVASRWPAARRSASR